MYFNSREGDDDFDVLERLYRSTRLESSTDTCLPSMEDLAAANAAHSALAMWSA